MGKNTTARVIKAIKDFYARKHDAICLLGMSSILLVLAFFMSAYDMGLFVHKLDKKGIDHVEELIGDYSSFYVVASTKNAYLPHDIAASIMPDENMILLLPENADISNVILDFYTMWDEYLVSYSCDFETNLTYTIKDREITVIQSDMQFVFIDMEEDDYQRVAHSNKEHTIVNKEKATCKVTSYDTEHGLRSNAGRIQPRGSASWHLYDKLPYSIKLDSAADLFDLGNSKKWNLLANNSDKTLLKDMEWFKFAEKLELQHTPRLHHIQLFINQDYMGVYSVCTKTKKGLNDVNIDDKDYLINWGSPSCDTKVRYKSTFWPGGDFPEYTDYVDVVWPDKDRITAQNIKEVKEIVQNFVDEVEKGKDADLSKVIDLDSFAKYYWLQEIAMNGDGWYRSNYMWYNHEDGKLYQGPLWDMEWSFGSLLTQHDHKFDNPQGWMYKTDSYWAYLFQNQEFVDAVNRIYYDYDIESLMYEMYDDYFKQATALRNEGELNYRMWVNEAEYFDLSATQEATNYQEWVAAIMSFYKERIDWLSNEMKKTNGVKVVQ